MNSNENNENNIGATSTPSPSNDNIEQKLYSQADFDRLKNNIKGQSYNEGKVAGVEIALKDFCKKNGIEVSKDIDSVVNSIVNNKLAEAGVKTEEKDAIIENLKKSILERDSKINEIQALHEKSAIESTISLSLASVKLNSMTPKELLAVMKVNGIDYVNDNGKIVAQQNGQIVRSNLQEAVDFVDFAKQYAESKGLISKEEPIIGRGKDNQLSKPNSVAFQNYEQLSKYFEKNNIRPESVEGQKAIMQAYNNSQNKDSFFG